MSVPPPAESAPAPADQPSRRSTGDAAREAIVTVDEALTGSPGWSELKADGGSLLWLESRPAEGRRSTIVRHDDGQLTELTPAPFSVRSRVMEYGGGAWDARGGVVVAVDDQRQQVAVLGGDTNDERALTSPSSEVRFAGLQVHPERDLVVAVREDHRVLETGAAEPETTIVALSLSGTNDDFGRVLVRGASFVAGPRLSDEGRLAWFEWNHPDMPWDRSAVRVAPLPDEGQISSDAIITVMDEAEVSAQHPQWDGSTLWFMADASGHWNLHAWTDDEGALAAWPTPHDCDHPVWTNAPPRWTVADGEAVVHRMSRGWPELGSLTVLDGALDVAAIDGLADVDSAVIVDGVPHVLVHRTDRGDAVVRLVAREPDRFDADEVRYLDAEVIAGGERPRWRVTEPISIHVPSVQGDVQAWLYLPPAADEAGDLPPLIVKSHGGPTSYASIAHSPLNDFWTSRGFAVVDVNYSGSTGFGRDYRNRLRGQWGVLDVADCAAVVDDLIANGVIDARRVSITGGSAGGYTTLQSLVTTDRYTAGVSRYGIGDLMMLATDTHKFESRYLDSLVGRWPDDEATYRERSPILHVDALSTPMLILQGEDDKVVPPNQAQSMADAVAAKGLPVELKLYRGEGHGFRGSEARRDALVREFEFYTRLWKLTPEA